jgi:hypothetical protein
MNKKERKRILAGVNFTNIAYKNMDNLDIFVRAQSEVVDANANAKRENQWSEFRIV